MRKLVVSCIPCNKRVELEIDDMALTFHKGGSVYGHILLSEFIAYPHILCKDCFGAADVEVIDEAVKRKQKKTKCRKTTTQS